MAQIPFRPKYSKKKQPLQLDTLVNAAWQFAYAALWQEQHFYPKEIARVKQEIREYFERRPNVEEAFTTFCERIAIIGRLMAAEKSRLLPHPAIWFNSKFSNGFSATLPLYAEMQAKQQEIPGFCEGIVIMSNAYWKYQNKPSGTTIKTCRKQLLHLKEYGLIQLLYNSIIYSQLLNPVA